MIQIVYIFSIFLPMCIKENVIPTLLLIYRNEKEKCEVCADYYLWHESLFLREGKLGFSMLSFPNVTASYLSPYFLSFWVGSLHSQLSVWIGLVLPKGKSGSCLSRLIYEALKSTTDQKYLLHWPAISAWNSHDKNHPLKVFCRHAWFIWVNKTLCSGKRREWENGKVSHHDGFFYLISLWVSQ